MSNYGPSSQALESAKSDDRVIFYESDDLISFYPSDNNNIKCGIVFFHGANVDVKSYSILGKKLAEEGVPFVALKMTPLYADFNPIETMNLLEFIEPDIKWYLAGHSLGGAIASRMMSVYDKKFLGMILLASYVAGRGINLSNKKHLKALSIWATYDCIISKERIFSNKNKLPDGTIYHEIKGGNHAQFGSYGHQNGDGTASITESEQIEETVRVIEQFLKGD